MGAKHCHGGWAPGEGLRQQKTKYIGPFPFYASWHLLSAAEPVFVNVKEAQESTPPAYVAWHVVVPARWAGNRFRGS